MDDYTRRPRIIKFIVTDALLSEASFFCIKMKAKN